MASRKHYGDFLQLRADLWRVPLALSIGAVVFFLVTVNIDWAVAKGRLTLPWWVSVGGPDDARAILGALLGAVSTVLALIFSVALLVLTMSVTQFGPRILYRFVRDGITQVTIGLFLASFVQTLLALVVERQDRDRLFVPQLTVSCSVVLVMLSFWFLIVFSHRIAMSIQTQNVVARIVADLDTAIADVRFLLGQLRTRPRSPAAEAEREALVSRCEREGEAVRAPRTGFVQEVDLLRLLAAVEKSDALVRLLYRSGQFVLEGAPVAQVVPAARATALAPVILRYVKIGTQRTLTQDLEFGIAQLVEIALRALSPALNDTFTGLTCIDWLGDELRVFASIREGTGVCYDDRDAPRVMYPPVRFARLVKSAFAQIRQAAVGNAAVAIRLFQTFGRLAAHIEDARYREALLEQVEAVWEQGSGAALAKSDRADIEAAYRAAREALGVH